MTTTTDYFKNFNIFGDKWAEFAKTIYEPVSELQKITTSAIERTTKFQIEAANEILAASTEKAQKLANIKKFEELTNFYRDASQEANDKAVAYTKASVDNAIQTSSEFTKWFEKGVENFKHQAAKTTSK
ncbi:phasin family protein [Thiotrichales bacterium 19S3-7]|nr:phasin family protein [Thiotrichales bacterium 19S3-7]MCF6802105.1 phasin family protein [Thiotrichales bacterium 19S3-11]